MRKKRTVVFVILTALSVGLAVFGCIILPDTVVIQISAGSSGHTTAPKAFAVMLPTALGVGGAVGVLLTKDYDNRFRKSFWVSVIGIGLSVLTITINMLFV